MHHNGSGRHWDGRGGLRLAALALALGLAGCTVLRLEHAKVVDADDWLTEGDSPRRENRADVTLDPPLEEAWTVNAGAGFGPVSPLILGETVLAATRKGEVVAVHRSDGKKLGTQGFGDVIEGSPVIAGGVLFVPVAWGKQTLRAYDLVAAKERWARRDLPPIEAGLLLLEDVLIAVDVESKAHAVAVKTGEELWSATLDERASVLATPVVSRAGHVLVADDRGRVVALRPEDGAPVWTRDLDAPVEVTPTTDGHTLFLATTRARLFALDADRGAVRWVFEAPDPTVRLAAPAISGDDLVFGGSDGVLRALDSATGALRWTFEAPDAITAPPLITRNTVYVGTMGRWLYAVDRSTGEKRWEHRLKGRVKSPMAARDGVLVVLTEPHEVYLFRPAKKALAAGK